MSDLKEVINLRDKFFEEQDKLYLAMVNQINSQMKELLKKDLGNEFMTNCARDFAGEIVRNYLPVNTGEMYITADQMFDRIINFRYDNDIDPLSSNEEIRKMLYNNENSEIFNQIAEESQKAQKQLFTEDRSQDKLDREGKLKYRESKKDENGILTDELTGQKGEFLEYEKNGQKYQKSDMHADHIQSRAAAKYNSEYITEKGVEKLKEFINSDDNFQIIHASANTSKGDVRVYDENGIDITYKATPEQMVEATCERWEEDTKSGNKKAILKEKGYLDKNGKVKKEVKEKLKKQYKESMNKESGIILQNINYSSVSKNAFNNTVMSFPKIFAGQIMYYGIPPIVYETKCIISNKNAGLDSFFVKLQKAFKRVINYMRSKLKNIMGNIAHNSLKSFLRNFFYILIDLLKATVKRVFKMIKDIVMALVNSIKILGDKNRTAAEIRSIFSKNGGNLAENGSVSWQFKKKAIVMIPSAGNTEESLMDIVLDAGAEDIEQDGEVFTITGPMESLSSIVDALKEKGIESEEFKRMKKMLYGSFIKEYDEPGDIARMFLADFFKGINSFEYLEEITTINEQYVEQILNEVFNENKMILSVIKK